MGMQSATTFAPGQQGRLVSQPLEVKRFFGFIRVNVPAGHQCLVFRNGRHYKTYDAGQHNWQDFGLFIHYTAQVVDAREQSIGPILATGDLFDAQEGKISIKVPLTLNYRLRDIGVFLDTADPIDKLIGLVTNQVATLVAQLRFDPSQPWYLILRNDLEHYLVAISMQQTGLQVTGVLIASVPRDDALVTRLIRERTLATERRNREIADAHNRGDIERLGAQAVADAASAVGANAADAWIARQQGGEALIDANVKIKAIEAAAGAQLGVTPVTPQQQQPPQLPAGNYNSPNTQPGASGWYGAPTPNSQFNPASPYGQSSPNNSYGSPAGPSNWQTPTPGASGGFGAPAAPTQPRATPPFPSTPSQPITGQWHMASGQISQQRLSNEQQRLAGMGFEVEIEWQQSPLKLTARSGTSAGLLQIVFRLDQNYPQSAPSDVQVKRGSALWEAYPRPGQNPSPTLSHWSQASWLSDIAQEIVANPSGA